MKRKNNQLAIEALRAQVQRIAFDANLFDRGIADYPYAEECSKKRKELNAEIVKLGGKVAPPRPSPNIRKKQEREVFGEGAVEQLSFLESA